MAPEGGKRKNKKQYYIANKKAKRQSVLQEGMRGFLLTCNNREKEAVREAYNLLNEYREKLFGSQTEPVPQDVGSEDSGDSDIEAALEKEKADLNKERSKKPSDRTFQVVDSGAKNCVFIKTTLDCPEKLMEEIISDLEKTKKLKSRFILRMIPVLVTCKTAEKNIEAGVAKAIENVFVEGSNETFCINFKTRNNNQVKRDDVIQLVTKLVRARPGISKVDLKTPDITVIVDVIRAVVCVSVVRNFFQRRKYNLAELGKPEEVKKEEEVVAIDKKEEEVIASDKKEEEVVASDKKEEEVVASDKKEEEVVASDKMDEGVIASDKMEVGVVASDKKEEMVTGDKENLQQKEEVKIDLEDESKIGFAVVPLTWCPHLETVSASLTVDVSAPCEKCLHAKENWLCLVCNAVYCSRYVNNHMVDHGERTEHCMVLSYSDLSVWCYGCDSYVNNEKLESVKKAAYKDKFKQDA